MYYSSISPYDSWKPSLPDTRKEEPQVRPGGMADSLFGRPTRPATARRGRVRSDRSHGRSTRTRAARLDEIRQAIADGTYLTEDKLSSTIDQIMDVLQ